jgi:hypothetical protein
MKTFAVFLCLIATTADAAPLYLECEGIRVQHGQPGAWPVTYSLKIDGATVTLDGTVMSIHGDRNGDVWAFGDDQDWVGTFNHITGRIEATFSLSLEIVPGKAAVRTQFEGVCRKTTKRF